MAIPTLCRLEYYTPKGWHVGHSAINLLEPERYVQRLAKNGKFGRVTVLDPDTLQPTGQVWAPEKLPDPSELVPSRNNIPALPPQCSFCGERHSEGSCLI